MKVETNDFQKHQNAPAQTWGAAYHIPPARVKEVKEYLDIREINGYSIQYATFHVRQGAVGASAPPRELAPDSADRGDSAQELGIPSAPSQIKCLVYIGLPTNPQFLGPQDPQALAEHIVKSKGPSGENPEYLFNLETSLEKLKTEAGLEESAVEVDEHVEDLARRVREIQAKR